MINAIREIGAIVFVAACIGTPIGLWLTGVM